MSLTNVVWKDMSTCNKLYMVGPLSLSKLPPLQ